MAARAFRPLPWSDIRDLQRKAQAWCSANLQGRILQNKATGWQITMSRAGRGKIGAKGERLLQAVPALEALIAQAKHVGSAPEGKNRDHIKAYHYLSATIQIDGRNTPLIVTIREVADGRMFYDLSHDNGVGARTRGPMGARESRVEPDMELGADALNLAFASPSVNLSSRNSDPELTPAMTRQINAAAHTELA